MTDPPIATPSTAQEMTMKPSFEEIPAEVMWQVASLLTSTRELSKAKKVTGDGKQYGFMGWRRTPRAKAKYRDAALRHLLKMALGERIDKDSGFPHSICFAANAIILADLDTRNASGKESDEETSPRNEEDRCLHTRKVVGAVYATCSDCGARWWA